MLPMNIREVEILYFFAVILASIYFIITGIKNDLFGSICLIIVAGFYAKSLFKLQRNEMDGLAMICIASVLLWLLALNDLLGLAVGAMEGLTPPLILTPFSLFSIFLISRRGEFE